MKRWFTEVTTLGERLGQRSTWTRLRTDYGKYGLGRYVAWVPSEHGRWPQKPGFSKLFYDTRRCPSQGTAPRRDNKGNKEALPLLRHPQTVPANARTVLPQDDEIVSGWAWLMDSPGRRMNCFTIRSKFLSEALAYVDEYHPEQFEFHQPAFGADVTYVVPMMGDDGEIIRDMYSETSVCRPDVTQEEVEDMVAKYKAFPVYARLRWA